MQKSFTVSPFNHKRVCEGGNLWSVILNLHVSKWRISKIGLFHEPLALQIQKIPRKLNDRKFKPSSKMSQEIFWSDSSRTAGILARSFEAPTSPFQRSYRCTWKKKPYFIREERLGNDFTVILLYKHPTNRIRLNLIENLRWTDTATPRIMTILKVLFKKIL